MSGTTGRGYPWGTGRPPALACDHCRKRIGARRRHFADGDRTHVFCGRCFTDHGRELHARFHPDCPNSWHDSTHGVHFATRFSMWHALLDPESHRDESL